MAHSGFDSLFDSSYTLSDFLTQYKSKKECYRDYVTYVTSKYSDPKNSCEFCLKDNQDLQTFKASWTFEYLDAKSSFLTLLVVYLAGALFGSIISSVQKIRFSTVHVACVSCACRVRSGQSSAKALELLLSTMLIFSILGLVVTIMLLYFQPSLISVYTVLGIAIALFMSAGFAYLIRRYERFGLVGPMKQIAKQPIVLDSIKFHRV